MLEISTAELCKDIPWEFKTFMDYTRGLEFTQKPDYEYLINLFYGCMDRHNIPRHNTPLLWCKND